MNVFEKILEEDKLEETARELLDFSGKEKVFLFHAPMGAGKTTFIKALCRALGVSGSMSSPTYSIVNEYEAKDKLSVYHFDLYRIKNIAECMDIGFEEYVNSDRYCFIEWPEVAVPLLPEEVLEVRIQLKENVRYLYATKKHIHA